jgi:hypothetical protein
MVFFSSIPLCLEWITHYGIEWDSIIYRMGKHLYLNATQLYGMTFNYDRNGMRGMEDSCIKLNILVLNGIQFYGLEWFLSVWMELTSVEWMAIIQIEISCTNGMSMVLNMDFI